MNKLVVSAGALAALALSTPAFAANTAQANATVNIVSPLTLTNLNNQALDFGTIVGPFNGETVEVTSAGVRTCGGLTCSGTTVGAAQFQVTNGTPAQNLALTVDPSVTMTSGANNLIVDLTNDLPTGLVTDVNGEAIFGVGGRLTIPAGTVDGVYTGTFNVRVDYQ